jgi:hypothetical protein
MKQATDADIASEMNEFYHNDIADLVKQFPTASAKSKYRIMQELKALTESFVDYYDFITDSN